MRKKISGNLKNGRTDLMDMAGLLLIVAVGILAYSNSFHCSFHFDDYYNIVSNLKIKDLHNFRAWWSFYPSRHVAIFTFVLNYHFFGLEVFYWHLVNLVIHLINALLVCWLVILLFSTPQMKGREIAGRKKLIAFFTALLFVSHPLATESVTYIVQRMASLAALFYLLSLILYVKARLTETGNLKKEMLFAGSFILAVMAIYTKENAFTLPFALCLAEIFFLRNSREPLRKMNLEGFLALSVFLVASFILLLKRSYHVFNAIPPDVGHIYTLTPAYYLLTQFSVIVKYIQLLFLPLNLTLDYNFPVATRFFEVRTFLSFSLLISLLILAIFLFKKNRLISFGIFWFFVTLSVESGIVPIIDVIFEHRTYLPSVGFFLAVTTALFSFRLKRSALLATIFLACSVVVLTFMTIDRNKVWKNDFSLWSDNVKKTPGYARPVAFLGSAYGRSGNWDKAYECYSRAIEMNPGFSYAYDGRGVALHHLGRFEGAIADYSEAVRLKPNYSEAYNNRGLANEELGRYKEALEDFSEAIHIQPDYRTAYYNRANYYRNRGQFEKALSDYCSAIRIDPVYADAYVKRGLVYGELGFGERSRNDFKQAVRLELLRRSRSQ